MNVLNGSSPEEMRKQIVEYLRWFARGKPKTAAVALSEAASHLEDAHLLYDGSLHSASGTKTSVETAAVETGGEA